jgi:Ca2+-binding RTX toxin-like protein
MMKKAIPIVVALLLAISPAAFARADGGVTLLISGGPEDSSLNISLSPDGREYVILSTEPLEVGGNLCTHPEEIPNELFCKATAIASFEVNAGGGSDFITFTSDIPVSVTIRGGPGEDQLSGGVAADKIIGGPDNDSLLGRRGDDWMLGGPGSDKLIGGPGRDQLRGGPDKDQLIGGPGKNQIIP